MEEKVERNGELGTSTAEQEIQEVRSGKASEVCGRASGCFLREMTSEFKVSKSCIGKVLRKLKITIKKDQGL
jgi:hypothetical protein